jgi:hypothetical protein
MTRQVQQEQRGQPGVRGVYRGVSLIRPDKTGLLLLLLLLLLLGLLLGLLTQRCINRWSPGGGSA